MKTVAVERAAMAKSQSWRGFWGTDDCSGFLNRVSGVRIPPGVPAKAGKSSFPAFVILTAVLEMVPLQTFCKHKIYFANSSSILDTASF